MMVELVKPGHDTFYLVDLAENLGICPKQARKKLRARFGTLAAQGGQRWAFKLADRLAVLEIIRGRS